MIEVLDCRGLKCPQPVLKVAILSNKLAPGTTLEVHGDCPTFAADIQKWCADKGKVMVSCVDRGGYQVATIQF